MTKLTKGQLNYLRKVAAGSVMSVREYRTRKARRGFYFEDVFVGSEARAQELALLGMMLMPGIGEPFGEPSKAVLTDAGRAAIADADKPKNKPEWHTAARIMRENGKKLREIAAVFGVTPQAVTLACKGVITPVDHQSEHRKNFGNAEWRKARAIHRKPSRVLEHADFIRAHYLQDMSAADIGNALGLTRLTVIGRARRLGLCRKREIEGSNKSE